MTGLLKEGVKFIISKKLLPIPRNSPIWDTTKNEQVIIVSWCHWGHGLNGFSRVSWCWNCVGESLSPLWQSSRHQGQICRTGVTRTVSCSRAPQHTGSGSASSPDSQTAPDYDPRFLRILLLAGKGQCFIWVSCSLNDTPWCTWNTVPCGAKLSHCPYLLSTNHTQTDLTKVDITLRDICAYFRFTWLYLWLFTFVCNQSFLCIV